MDSRGTAVAKEGVVSDVEPVGLRVSEITSSRPDPGPVAVTGYGPYPWCRGPLGTSGIKVPGRGSLVGWDVKVLTLVFYGE